MDYPTTASAPPVVPSGTMNNEDISAPQREESSASRLSSTSAARMQYRKELWDSVSTSVSSKLSSISQFSRPSLFSRTSAESEALPAEARDDGTESVTASYPGTAIAATATEESVYQVLGPNETMPEFGVQCSVLFNSVKPVVVATAAAGMSRAEAEANDGGDDDGDGTGGGEGNCEEGGEGVNAQRDDMDEDIPVIQMRRHPLRIFTSEESLVFMNIGPWMCALTSQSVCRPMNGNNYKVSNGAAILIPCELTPEEEQNLDFEALIQSEDLLISFVDASPTAIMLFERIIALHGVLAPPETAVATEAHIVGVEGLYPKSASPYATNPEAIQQQLEAVGKPMWGVQLASHIDSGSSFVADSLVSAAMIGKKLVNKHGTRLRTQIKPRDEPLNVGPRTKAAISTAEDVSKSLKAVTSNVTEKITTGIGMVATSIAPAIADQTDAVKSDSRSSGGTKAQLIEVGRAGANAALKVLDSFNEAASTVGSELGEQATAAVNVKYGEEAAELTGKTVNAAGNTFTSYRKVSRLGVKSIAKATAKSTAKEVVHELNLREECGDLEGSVHLDSSDLITVDTGEDVVSSYPTTASKQTALEDTNEESDTTAGFSRPHAIPAPELELD